MKRCFDTTRGPWVVRELNNDKVIPTFTLTGRTGTGKPVYVATFDRKRDALLAAAAPRMFALLRETLTRNNVDGAQELKAKIRRMLAKAQGNP